MNILRLLGSAYGAFLEIAECLDMDFLITVSDGRGNKATVDVANPTTGGGPEEIWHALEELFWSQGLERYRFFVPEPE